MSVRRRKRRKGEPREASSWRDVLKIDPAAELFPRSSMASAASTRWSWPAYPLVSDEGELTGARFDQLWEKERVCSTASGRQIKPGTDPYTYVISANIRRRHLTAEQKRELIAKLIKATPEKSDRAIA